ncbi:MAG: DnaJ C-terminal domain-containing protein [Halofilum sp. (in: g-proteobacteria)]|nr:DnaJ C-terminal domain-containing protein [Halofilum sp. (in: g-proteobacteria)]
MKRAYRKLARKYHPDVSSEPDAEDRFQEVQEAYEVLKDPEKRAAYDRLGENWQQGQGFEAPPGWDEGFEFTGGGFTGGDAGAFSDFFESLFGRGSAYGHAHGGRHGFGGFHGRGQDHFARVEVSLEEAYHGGQHQVTLQAPATDPQGRVQTRQRTLNVRIPAGVTEGQQIRLTGQGGGRWARRRPRTVYLEVALRPHPLFRAEGRDVHLDVPVAPWEAALGATSDGATLGGEVARGAQSRRQRRSGLRLRAAACRDRRRGPVPAPASRSRRSRATTTSAGSTSRCASRWISTRARSCAGGPHDATRRAGARRAARPGEPGLAGRACRRVRRPMPTTSSSWSSVGVVEPMAGRRPSEWRFPARAIARMRRALRLRHDLAVDPPVPHSRST